MNTQFKSNSRSLFQHRTTRRAVLGGALATGAGVGALILGCGGANSAQATFNRGAPKKDESLESLRERYHGRHLRDLPGQKDGPKVGGVYRDWGYVPASWDYTGPSASILASYSFINNPLLGFQAGDFAENPNLWNTEPCLCEKWEWPDSTSLIMHLQPNVKWQDISPVNGRPFAAEDVVYAVNAYRKAFVQSAMYRDVDKVEAQDRSTVKFTFKVPPAYFELAQTVPVNLMFAREQAESADGLAKRPIGTGAFVFEEGNDHIGFNLRRNPEYWRKDPRTGMKLPYLDRIEFNFIADPQSIRAAFRAKQLDGFWPQDSVEWEDVLKTEGDVVSQITTPPPSFQAHFEFRLDQAPWNDVRVRRALSMAFDRDAMIKGVSAGLAAYGCGTPWTTFDQEWPWRPDQLGSNVKFDVQAAKQLMDAAGFTNGLGRKAKLLFASDLAASNVDIYTLVADAWRRNLGMETEIDSPKDAAVWQAQYFTGSFDEIIGVGFVGPGADADDFTFGPLNSKSLRNYSHVNDPMLDDLTSRQGHEMNVNARRTLLRLIMERDLDQAYRIWTIVPYKINVRRPYVFNLTDQVHAWASTGGWGAKTRELVWLNK